jgi:hypothetical protein
VLVKNLLSNSWHTSQKAELAEPGTVLRDELEVVFKGTEI